MDGIKTLTRTTDLVYSPDDGGFYLQEYKLDGSHKQRTSKVYKNKDKLFTDWELNKIQWSKWE